MTDETIRYRVLRLAIIENCVTLAAIAFCTAAIAYFAHSPAGLWSLLLMLNLNSPKRVADEDEDDPDDDEGDMTDGDRDEPKLRVVA